MSIDKIVELARKRWPEEMPASIDDGNDMVEVGCEKEGVPEICDWLANEIGCHFLGLTVEEGESEWRLRYLFVGEGSLGHIQVTAGAGLSERSFPSVSDLIHAADWHEREAEDLFGLVFAGHPRLGDFILHDDAWQESVEPMRRGFDPDRAHAQRSPRRDWRPRTVVQAPGAFVMPIGPIYAGEAEAAHLQLETIGEEIIRAFPRLFYKYRAVEKLAEGVTIDSALLLAERFAATTAFAHGLAYSQAIEQLSGVIVPARALALRVFIAELERLRHHVSVIEGICRSTGLSVAANQTAILEEEALRLTGSLTGHRYLFGMVVPGGLSRDITDSNLREALGRATEIVLRLDGIKNMLRLASSFLDRLEGVGVITETQARAYGLVGPMARASGYCKDLRKLRPYSIYSELEFDVPCESEGDGYARLRVLFAEAWQALGIMRQVLDRIPSGPVHVQFEPRPGVAVAGVEAPRGMTHHWVRIDEERRIARYRLLVPSFANWHGFHLAVEGFAFQDLPIILATLALSVSESDR